MKSLDGEDSWMVACSHDGKYVSRVRLTARNRGMDRHRAHTY